MEELLTRHTLELCILLFAIVIATGLVLIAVSVTNYFKIKTESIKQVGLRNKMLTVNALIDAKAIEAVAQVAQQSDGFCSEWTDKDFDKAKDKAFKCAMDLAASTNIYTGEKLMEAYQCIEKNAEQVLKEKIENLFRQHSLKK